MHKTTRILLSFLFLATACSTPGNSGKQNESMPSPELEQSPKTARGTESITILGTNDIHGALAPMQLKTREPEGVAPISYQAGGMAYLASYVKRLRSELGTRLIWLDAGDEFQGTIESNPNRGAAMVSFFNLTGLAAAAVGNHEFDFGAEPTGSTDRLSALKNRMSEAHYPYLAANIYNKDNEKLAAFPNTVPSQIFQVGHLKVGVIGLSTLATPTTTRAENISPLKFGDLKEATLRESKALRESGAQIILIVAHAGLHCDLAKSQPGHLLRKPSDPQGECKATSDDPFVIEIPHLLRALPSGTVDAVVAGHSHTVVHHWVSGVPVIQGGVSGRYFNLIHLTYDTQQNKVIPDRTRIEGPIPVCPLVFRNQADCNGDRPAPPVGRGELVAPIFRKEKIRADSATVSLLKPTFEAAEKTKSEVYGIAARPIEHERTRESAAGNLVADALREAARSDFSLINSGGIRAPFEQGSITFGNIFRTVPFDNNLVILTVSGKRLKQILKIAESGSRGFHSVSGLRLRVIAPDTDAPAEDLNGDKKIEPWEINRLLEVRTSQGAAIQDNKEYTLATIDFLVSGGDDYGWVMSKIPATDRRQTQIVMRDAVAAHIRKISSEQGSINSSEHPLVDPVNPRLIFERPKVAKGKKAKKHRKKKRAR